MKRFLLYAVLALSTAPLRAQNTLIFSQYYLHKSLFNPAAVGLNEAINLALYARREWTSFPGTPTSNLFIGDMAFNHERMGVGIQLGQESIVATRTWHAAALYSYKINLSKGRLSFGAKLGMHQTHFNVSDLTIKDEQDKVLATSNQTRITPDIGFGLCYLRKKWSIGASAYNLSSNTQSAFISDGGTTRFSTNYSFQSTYLLELNPNWHLEPSVLGIYIPNWSRLGIVTAILDYKNEIYLGSSYRSNKSVAVIIGVRLDKISMALENLRIGYSYDLNFSSLNTYLNNTHEFTLSLVIDKPKNLRKEKQKPVEISPYDL